MLFELIHIFGVVDLSLPVAWKEALRLAPTWKSGLLTLLSMKEGRASRPPTQTMAKIEPLTVNPPISHRNDEII